MILVILASLQRVTRAHLLTSGSGADRRTAPMPLNYPLKANALKGSDANYGAH